MSVKTVKQAKQSPVITIDDIRQKMADSYAVELNDRDQAILTTAKAEQSLFITGNSKTGIAWDLHAIGSCLGATEACLSRRILKSGTVAMLPKCYAMNGNYRLAQWRYKHNYDMINFWHAIGYSNEAIAQKILAALEQHKGFKKIAWIRIHGSGDIFSAWYCQVLTCLAKLLKSKHNKGAYLYTRAYVISSILPSLYELASVADVNLSADYVNYQAAIDTYNTAPHLFRRVAVMHSSDATFPLEIAAGIGGKSNLIAFPEHSGGIETAPIKGIPTCPALLEVLKSDKDGSACQKCRAICHA